MSCPSSVAVEVGSEISGNANVRVNQGLPFPCSGVECEISFNGLSLLNEVTTIQLTHTVDGVTEFRIVEVVDDDEEAVELCPSGTINFGGVVCEECPNCVLKVFANANSPVDLRPILLVLFSCDSRVTESPTEDETNFPTFTPTTLSTTLRPTSSPSISPSALPSASPSLSPSLSLTLSPTISPSLDPAVFDDPPVTSSQPTLNPTTEVRPDLDDDDEIDSSGGNGMTWPFLLMIGLIIFCCSGVMIYLIYRRHRKKRASSVASIMELKEGTNQLMLKKKKKSSIMGLNRQFSSGQETVSTVKSLFKQAVYKQIETGSSLNGSNMIHTPLQPRHISYGLETVSTSKSFLFQPMSPHESQANSVITFKTTSSYKSSATRLDEVNLRRVKAVNSSHKRKLLKLSQLIWEKVPKNKTENEYMEDVLGHVLPFIDRKKTKFVDFTEFNDFSFNEEPLLDFEDYLIRLMQGLNEWYKKYETVKSYEIGTRCLVLALLYLDQMKINFSEFTLNVYNAHCLFAILMLVSAKFTEDEMITNSYWSVVSGLDLDQVSHLETVLCFKVGFDFSIATETLAKIMPALCE